MPMTTVAAIERQLDFRAAPGGCGARSPTRPSSAPGSAMGPRWISGPAASAGSSGRPRPVPGSDGRDRATDAARVELGRRGRRAPRGRLDPGGVAARATGRRRTRLLLRESGFLTDEARWGNSEEAGLQSSPSSPTTWRPSRGRRGSLAPTASARGGPRLGGVRRPGRARRLVGRRGRPADRAQRRGLVRLAYGRPPRGADRRGRAAALQRGAGRSTAIRRSRQATRCSGRNGSWSGPRTADTSVIIEKQVRRPGEPSRELRRLGHRGRAGLRRHPQRDAA